MICGSSGYCAMPPGGRCNWLVDSLTAPGVQEGCYASNCIGASLDVFNKVFYCVASAG